MESAKIERKWLVAYCKSRSEKLTSERLRAAGIEVYCPLQTTMRQWSDRKKKVKVPIFPSYIFVYVNEQERLSVIQDTGVSRFVFWLGKPAVVREDEMSVLKSFIEINRKESISLKLQEGRTVKINSGPFKNHEGVVLQAMSNSPRIVLKEFGVTLIATTALQISTK